MCVSKYISQEWHAAEILQYLLKVLTELIKKTAKKIVKIQKKININFTHLTV